MIENVNISKTCTNILNLNYINSLILYSSMTKFSNDVHYNTYILRVQCFLESFIFFLFFYLYYLPFLLQTGNTSECPFCRYRKHLSLISNKDT